MTQRLQDKRFWLVAGAAVALLIAVVAWFGVISPELSSAKSLDSQADAAEMQTMVVQGKIVQLRRQSSAVKQLTARLQAEVAALPFDTGLPGYTRQLAKQAGESHVSLTSIIVSPATVVTGAQPAATGTAAPGVTPAAAPAATLLATPISLVAAGPADNLRDFIRDIRVAGPRRALVASVQMAPATGGPSIEQSATMTVQLSVFTAPLSATAQAQLEKLLRGDVSG